MIELNMILDILVLLLLGLGGYGLVVIKAGVEAAVRTSAEEAAKSALAQLQWPAELARELQKTRGTERQELRFKCYGALWKELRPLAIYDTAVLNKEKVSDLSMRLSDWYFSEYGGLLLTPQARDCYFALQDVLQVVSLLPENWEVERSKEIETNQYHILRTTLAHRNAGDALSVLDYFSAGVFEDWPARATELAKLWRQGIKSVAINWSALSKAERFALLQQIGSILRTCLVNDLESRVR